jgi:hypothetical protein
MTMHGYYGSKSRCCRIGCVKSIRRSFLSLVAMRMNFILIFCFGLATFKTDFERCAGKLVQRLDRMGVFFESESTAD